MEMAFAISIMSRSMVLCGSREGHIDIVVDDLIAGDGDNTVVDALIDQVDGVVAHQRSVDAVTHRGRTAALDVAQNGCAGVDTGSSLDLVGQLLGTDDALGHDDDEVLLAGDLGLAHALQDVALEVEGDLRQQDSDSAGSDADIQGNITGVVAHNLNDAATVVALGGVAQFIDSLDSSVHGRVVTDSVFTAGNVVIDGAGQADAGDALVGQRTGTA